MTKDIQYNKINFVLPSLPIRMSYSWNEFFSYPVRVNVEYEWGNATRTRNNIRSHVPVAFEPCTDTCSFETERNVSSSSTMEGRERWVSNYWASRTDRHQGDDSRCQYVTAISMNNSIGIHETLHPTYSIKEAEVLIRQNPIFFIRSFGQIVHEIVRGEIDCMRGIVTFLFEIQFQFAEYLLLIN